MRPLLVSQVPNWRWALAALALAPYACHELYFAENDEMVPGRVEPADCLADDDCTLLPAAITCCGECEPVPPFEAVSRSTVDALLLDNETDCALRTQLCDPPACASVPEGCAGRAVCRSGRCTVVESGCGVRISWR